MTYGYGPHEWQPPVPEDDPDALYYREPPTVPPGYPRHSQAAQGQQAEPPTNPWQSAGGGSGTSGQGGSRRIPQAPPPARHVAPTGGVPTQPTYSPTSPARPTSPAHPTSTPPSVRRPPPNNQGGQPPAYPAFPPPVPTSPTVPRSTPGPAKRPPVPQGRAGAPPTGALSAPPAAGPGVRPGAPVARPAAAPLRPGPPMGRLPAPPQAPGRRAPVRRSLPPTPRPRAVSLREVPGIIRQLPQHKPWMVAIGAIAVAVVVAVCSFGSFMLFRDENAVIGAPTAPETTVLKRDITSREKDPTPLTPADVFPSAEIIADPAIPPYVRVGEVQTATDCRVGATGEVGKRLVALQCNQVIRASFSTPDNNYFVTGGIFNLPDSETAAMFSTEVPGLMDAKQGAITGYASDPDVNVVLVRAPTNVTWEVRGHFLVYTVVAKKDGSAFEPDDAGAKVITYDILQMYLRDTVLDQWSIDKTPPSASTSASPPA